MVENKFFPEIHGNFGFGCMRLPMQGKEVDHEQFNKMIDAFIAAGLNYFDTAHGYIDGKSETAIAKCLSARYDRSQFLLTNKLTDPYFNKQEDIRPFFEKQLKWCGVDYFDFYLMHAQNKDNYKKFQACKAYETAFELKKEGKIKHVGLSFHDKAEVLDMILTDHPEVEVVQIQFNYVDYEDASVESRKVYEVCEKHNKPVIVMEPVKGGSLVNLPEEADKVFRALGDKSNASYAIRFAASFPSMTMVLSGMSDPVQMQDNLKTFEHFQPVDEMEHKLLEETAAQLLSVPTIQCTACRYCCKGCPKKIEIPEIFKAVNMLVTFGEHIRPHLYYDNLRAMGSARARDCIACGQCEGVCPQHLPIIELLRDASQRLDK